jgi:hypothetical protein
MGLGAAITGILVNIGLDIPMDYIFSMNERRR